MIYFLLTLYITFIYTINQIIIVKMKKIIFTLAIFCLFVIEVVAAPGDTTFIQTFDFSLGRRTKIDTFQFPDGTQRYSKVLMYYTIKCDPTGDYTPNNSIDYPCGEWDYDVFTDILQPIGVNNDSSPKYKVNRIWTYITPYGINIDRDSYMKNFLNTNGWTYVFDVTDFLPLLKGDVILRDNNGQELVDIKFAFIEGTPARDVIDVKQVWNSIGVVYPTHWEGYPLSKFDSIVRDTTFDIAANEKQVKLRTTVTGHFFGQGKNCAEFCKNIHSVSANGEIIRSWNIIQQCADNPIYPQGGTWLYDRAGWCPGTEGKTNEFELSRYVTNGRVTFDYNVENDNYGVYRITSYLVTYGDINNADDVEASLIISPTTDPQQRRHNPSAFSPIVVIKNLGSNNLTFAVINYGFEGGELLQYEWKGSLAFLEQDTVTLYKIPDWNAIQGNTAKFYFEITMPNGVADPTPYNNRLESVCEKPTIVNANNFIVSLTTNRRPQETYWQITDVNGNIVASVAPESLTASKTFENEINLPDGTYCLSYYDTAEDGLGWWANQSQVGAGNSSFFYIDDNGQRQRIFSLNPDFGAYFRYWFVANKFSNVSENGGGIVDKNISVYPNPSSDVININLAGIAGENLTADIYSPMGSRLKTISLTSNSNIEVDVKELSNGVYNIVVRNNKQHIASGKFIIAK